MASPQVCRIQLGFDALGEEFIRIGKRLPGRVSATVPVSGTAPASGLFWLEHAVKKQNRRREPLDVPTLIWSKL